jgi:hypothetical protein
MGRKEAHIVREIIGIDAKVSIGGRCAKKGVEWI